MNLPEPYTTFPSDVVTWEDVEAPASKMFRVWVDGGELHWARECWSHFAEAGLNRAGCIIETTTTYLRLVELSRIYEEFSGFAWDENPETPLGYLAEDLEIHPIALGMIASEFLRENMQDFQDDTGLHQAALESACSAQRLEIFRCLSNAYGGAECLYSRMFHTHPSAVADDDSEFEVTQANSAAFEFVTNGFKI